MSVGSVSAPSASVPMSTAATVVSPPSARAPWRIAAATDGGSLTEVAAWMTTSASTSPEASRERMVFSYAPASAAAPRSIGLRAEARPGAAARRASWVAAESSGTSRPASADASAARMPGPPALPMMPRRLPAGTGCPDSSWTTSSSSSVLRTWITPACRSSVVTTTSGVAAAAVWEAPPRAPASVRPALSATIGLLRAMRRACRRNFFGLPNDSRYSAMTLVVGSSSQ